MNVEPVSGIVLFYYSARSVKKDTLPETGSRKFMDKPKEWFLIPKSRLIFHKKIFFEDLKLAIRISFAR